MEKTTTIGAIADRLYRHPLMKGLSFESILAYTVDFIQIVGLPELFEEKTAVLHIENWRASLPCDYVKIIQLRTLPDGAKHFRTYRAATSSFHMSPEHTPAMDLTYKIQGDFIYTSNKCGDIEIAYQAFATDNDGYPLIPDNGSFPKALENYIKREWFTVLFDMGRCSQQSLQNAQQQYVWSVGRAVEDLRMLTLDQAESLMNSWKTLIIRDREHESVYANTGTREYILKH